MTKRAIFLLLTTALLRGLFAEVPAPYSRIPDIEYFLQPFNLRTVEMAIFSADASNMIRSKFGNLNWNPAYLAAQNQRTIYLDFNLTNPTSTETDLTIPLDYPYLNRAQNAADFFVPRWYTTTQVKTINTEPLYNFAIILPVSSRLTIGATNRSIFDYGAYRNPIWWQNYGWRNAEADAYANIPGLTPSRLEVDDNQQQLFTNHTEVNLAYRFSEQFDLGLRLGNLLSRHSGHLIDDEFGTYAHSSFANYNKEKLTITGDHYEVGLGIIYHENERNTWGLFAGILTGDSREEQSSLDTAANWSETATNPAYYYRGKSHLSANENFSDEGQRPYLKLMYTRKFGQNIYLDAKFAYSQTLHDFTSNTSSSDTSSSDHTYDTWNSATSSYYFQRLQLQSARDYTLNGSGTDDNRNWQAMVTVTYAPGDDWEFFSGLQCAHYRFSKKISESDILRDVSYYEYTYYDPKTSQYLDSHRKNYDYQYQYDTWRMIVPFGIAFKTPGKLRLILGSELCLELHEESSEGEILFPEVISRYWYNQAVLVDDVEHNRYEKYTAKPPRSFQRTTTIRVGAALRHPSGVTFYLRPGGELFTTTSWTLGLAFDW